MLVKMQSDEFLSAKNLTKAITKRKKNINEDQVSWLKMQWLRFSKQKEYCIQYKYTLNEEMPFEEIDLKPSKKGRLQIFHLIGQDKLYDGPRIVSALKKRDMMFLLKYIPPVHRQFFRNIKGDKAQEDVGPLPNDSDDSEAEN